MLKSGGRAGTWGDIGWGQALGLAREEPHPAGLGHGARQDGACRELGEHEGERMEGSTRRGSVTLVWVKVGVDAAAVK